MEIGYIVLLLSLIGICVVLYRKYSHCRELYYAKKLVAEMAESEKLRLMTRGAGLESENKKLSESLSTMQIENAKLSEKIDNIESFAETMQKEAEGRFRLLASDIFSNQTKDFRATSEARLAELLQPLRENITDFKKVVNDNYINEAKERSVLSQHLQTLMKLNESIGKEARDLTVALTGNSKVQGDWGEMILESILEKSGLVEGENYFVQPTTQEDGQIIVGEGNKRLRPDVVVILPGKKYIVIDSKVSLSAYVQYVNADTDDSREQYGKAHIHSVRNHLKELEAKKYQDYIGMSDSAKMDYVLMFIPNEHAYMTAMSLDKNLWMEAYDKRVVIISPAHVISTLRLIAQLWTRDKQTKNAIRIAEESGKLYDKFVGFVGDMQDIGAGMKKAQDAYDKAFKKLQNGTGNLISRTQKLKELGAKTEKMLPGSND